MGAEHIAPGRDANLLRQLRLADSAKPLIIVNPRSGGGLSERRWARLAGRIADGLGELDVAFTKARGDAIDIARREAAAGRRLVVALGGDGTISEVANGILRAGAGGTTDLGVIPRGTGGDFRRSLDLPSDMEAAARRIRDGRVQVVDAGRARFVAAASGEVTERFFVNVASFGFSSEVASRANASSKRFGGKVAFLAATVRAIVSYDNTDVWLSVDGRPRQRRRVLLAAVGNGRYFGGGMKICPTAALDSGRLDVVVVGDFSRGEVLARVGRLYDGTHLELEEVHNLHAHTVTAEPVEPDAQIPVELDGETPGRLPATFEILPAALRVRV
jgi:YegS/Rv2252/BmrU family lipid kinase